MELQAYINQYRSTGADNKSSHYGQGFINTNAETAHNKPKQMRVLFSGHGKAERNMGMAPIPPLSALNAITDFKKPT